MALFSVRVFLVGTLVVALLPACGFQRGEGRTPSVRPQIFRTPQQCSEFLRNEAVRVTNETREDVGLPPLVSLIPLERAAESRTLQMIHEKRLTHRGWTREVLRELPSSSLTHFAQNLARGLSTPQALLRAWMRSPSHRKNLLDPKNRYIGIGCYRSTTGEHWWTQNLAG
ncbi:CAP domain-containing protein [bacterium]|nr:CAP domain-containing protein [bacterium]